MDNSMIPRWILTLVMLYFVYQGSMIALVLCLFLMTVSIEISAFISKHKKWKNGGLN